MTRRAERGERRHAHRRRDAPVPERLAERRDARVARCSARSVSTPTHDVPPAPETSMCSTPDAEDARGHLRRDPAARLLDDDRHAQLLRRGARSSRARQRKSRSPPGCTSSIAGFRWTQSASAPTSSTSACTSAVVMPRACTTPRLPSRSARVGATSRTRNDGLRLGPRRASRAGCRGRSRSRAPRRSPRARG